MDSIVEQILRGVDKGNTFDSHFVIDTIIRDHSDDYLTFVANHLASSKVTELKFPIFLFRQGRTGGPG